MERTGPDIAPSSGLLSKRVSMEHFDLIRIAPSDVLRPFIENYWIVLWDLTGKPAYSQENLPHPSVNMVVVPGDITGIFGVQTGKWVYRLEGAGRIFGIKFKPGCFKPFFDRPVSDLTDTSVPIGDVFATDHASLEAAYLAHDDPEAMQSDIETLLLEKNPVLDRRAGDARACVALIADNPDITTLARLAKVTGTSARTLQRLFDTHVGVGPKWVIDRYRMLGAVDAINRGEPISLTSLAHELGYFDQAHFTRTFTALTGNPPSFYRRDSAASP